MKGRVTKLSGKRFGYLLVTSRAPKKGKHARWHCRCDCGKETVVRADLLLSGRSKACGIGHHYSALIMQVAKAEYRIWKNMLWRVDYKYKNYGGRGIKVCKRWRRFENFLSDMRSRPSSQHSLDRYPNNNGNYEPANCRWATRRQQQLNTRKTVKCKIAGREISVTAECEKLGLSRGMVIRRLERGWAIEDAFAKPPQTIIRQDSDYPVEWLLGVFSKDS